MWYYFGKMDEIKLTKKQQLFCDEYMTDMNATQAYLRVFKSCKSATVASSLSTRLLGNANVRAYLEKMRQEKHDKLTATADEVVEYLTSVLRGTSTSEIVVVEATGDGTSSAKNVKKKPDEKDRMKAAELLGKYHALYTDKHKVDVQPVNIVMNIPKKGD